MNKKQRLELTWIGKDQRPRLEPRILLHDAEKSYHAPHRREGVEDFDNRLIFGDNLLTLKSLEQDFTGQVKCVYIDPPFNTQQALKHYEDGLEHSIWLGLIRDRIEIIHRLLSEDGSLFIHIDDNEIAYLIVMLDEIFGRKNRISIITFKQGSATGHKSINPGVVSTSNFILLYAKNKEKWTPNKVYTARDERDKRYNQFIENYNDNYENWKFITLSKAFSNFVNVPEKLLKKHYGENFENEISFFIQKEANKIIRLARPDYKAVSSAARTAIDESKSNSSKVFKLEREELSDMYFYKGERILFYSEKLKIVDGEYVAGEPLTSIWDDILSNNLHNEGGVDFPKGKKPEALIKRCFDLCTNPGDLVLDSFAGSGTTGAVAHKMGRRWIMVELGEHCHTHIIPRMQKVIDGTDQGGISKAVNWKGGGGFRYYRLAPSLIVKDKYGMPIINKEYNAEMLAEAMCKHKGFTYAPNPQYFWMHGQSSETDYIFVTTQKFTHDALRLISEEVGDRRTLLICCPAWSANVDAFPNLTLQKIPQSVLNRCEWGKDDYSLNVANLPLAEEQDDSTGKQPSLLEIMDV